MKLLTKVLVICIPGLLISAPSLVQADLVAYWTGNNTAVDATGNGHDGTLINGATYGAGVIGDAFHFDGINDLVSVAANVDLEPNILSVALWVQAIPENHLRLLIDSTHGVGQAGWALQLNAANNISFAYGNGTTFPEVSAGINIGDGAFHHVAATFDGSQMRLYVDGLLSNSLAYSGSPLASGRDIEIGNHIPLNRPLQGALDDIRIYNHALSQQEVSALLTVPEPSGTLICLALLVGSIFCRRR